MKEEPQAGETRLAAAQMRCVEGKHFVASM
jgi:hypothetical protein